VFYSANGVSGWSQQSKLVASDGGADDNFGYSVSVYGDVIAVGAYYADTSAGSNAGEQCYIWY
jgi:hypothetical protein